jgi:hypothetical protein
VATPTNQSNQAKRITKEKIASRCRADFLTCDITVGLGVATKPKTLGYNFAKKTNTFKS